jgi:hypothetical protein
MVELLLGHLPAPWRDYIFDFKRLRGKRKMFPTKQMLIFRIETVGTHGGFADRMKGIVSLFHLCLYKGIPFKIHYTAPFELSDFLLPNEYDWRISEEEISYNRKEAKSIHGAQLLPRVIRENSQKQMHVLQINGDFVEDLNKELQTNYRWGELYKKLFKPTEELQSEIDKHVEIITGNYVCAVFRFQNLLGDFREYEFPALSEAEQKTLMQTCRNALVELQEKEGKKMLVTSDSEKFLTSVVGLNAMYAFPAKVVHLDTTEHEAHSVYLKSFVDFYVLSQGEKIYCIGTKEMYPSQFPMYAAKVNNIPFERILIE